MEAPLYKGQRVGTYYALVNGEVVAQSGIVVAEDVPSKSFESYFYKIFNIFVSNTDGDVIY